MFIVMVNGDQTVMFINGDRIDKDNCVHNQVHHQIQIFNCSTNKQ